MTPLEELIQLISEKSRRIFVAENTVDLSISEGHNCVYVLQLPVDVSGAAGGRVGGIGERKIVKIHCFRQENGHWMKLYDTENEEKLEKFELPYHAAGLAVILPNGTEKIVSGVVDQDFIQRYNETV
ncbi:MAG TPA: hypothetical protein VEH56_08115 [Candidatus Saccharimonadales bacterium]|nr:hypothetical protein [Candidatus Saccharimonadales bacterium]